MASSVARLALFLGAAFTVLPACQQGDITTYRVPKEAAPTLAAPPTGAPAHREADWTVPPGWREQPLATMRVGSFLAKGSNGKDVDISVVPLAGEVGGELANVNRWLGQLNLSPVDESGLSRYVTSRRIGAHTARLVEFSNDDKRLVAAIVRHDNTSWFFKAMGDDRAVRDIKPAFLTFVESVRFHHHE